MGVEVTGEVAGGARRVRVQVGDPVARDSPRCGVSRGRASRRTAAKRDSSATRVQLPAASKTPERLLSRSFF